MTPTKTTTKTRRRQASVSIPAELFERIQADRAELRVPPSLSAYVCTAVEEFIKNHHA